LVLSLCSFILFLLHLFALQLQFVIYQLHLIPVSSFLPCRFISLLSSFMFLLLHLVSLQFHFVIYQLHLIAASYCCVAASFGHLAASSCHLEAWLFSPSNFSLLLLHLSPSRFISSPSSFILSPRSLVIFTWQLQLIAASFVSIQVHFVT
jgi:hypothetical protein